MKHLLQWRSLVLARLRQTLRSLPQWLRVEPPRQALSPVAVPIRPDRTSRLPARRLPDRGD
jgi:hypothetical protein